MTTPIQRLTRLLNEGARFKVELPGQLAIDLTPDIIAAIDHASSNSRQLDRIGNLLKANDSRRDVPTRVHFP